MEELNIIPEPEKVHPLKHMFVTDNIAKEVKRLGFNEACFAYYFQSAMTDKMNFKLIGENQGYTDHYVNFVGEGLTNTYMQVFPTGRQKVCFTAPLVSQVVDWLEEHHNTSVMAFKHAGRWQYDVEAEDNQSFMSTSDGYETKDDALCAGIDHALRAIYIINNLK